MTDRSVQQENLDNVVHLITEAIGEDAVEEAYLNDRDHHLPCLVISGAHWLETAKLLKHTDQVKMNYLRNVSGVDYETHFEVVYHLLSLYSKEELCIKIRTEKDAPSVPSVTPVWETANWNEREIFDLFGIDFPGHPDLRRIMMPDDWEGHPLRKDYEPLDPEV